MTEYIPFALVVAICTAPIALAARGLHDLCAKPHEVEHTIEWPPNVVQLREQVSKDKRPTRQLNAHDAYLRRLFRLRPAHCARCGRFGRRVPELNGAVVCVIHGLTVHVVAHEETLAA